MTSKTDTAATIDKTLVEDIISFLRRFVIFQDENQYLVLALWIIHTHNVDAAYATPYLYIKSAEKQSGKTRTIETAELLAHSPVTGASLTASSLFRVIESSRPTLFIDEADAIWAGAKDETLRSVINSGYKKNGTVLRTVPGQDGGEVKPFSTFCPKLLAGIDNGAMPDTILDRCIIFTLKRKKKDQEVERMIERKIAPEVESLKARIQAWSVANTEALLEAEPKMIEEISDRAFEIAEPLLAIAGRFRGLTAQARKALTEILTSKVEKLSPGAEALTVARDLMAEGKRDRLTSAEWATALDISPKKLGVILAPYGITPGTIRLSGSITAKGYYLKDLADAFERYI